MLLLNCLHVFQVAQLVGADKLLLSHHNGYAHALMHLPVEPPGIILSPEYPPACGVRFSTPSIHLRGSPLRIRVQLSRGRQAGAWLGMVAVGSPNECMFDMVVDLDDLPLACFTPDGTISIEWPLNRVPSSSGNHGFASLCCLRSYGELMCALVCVFVFGLWQAYLNFVTFLDLVSITWKQSVAQLLLWTPCCRSYNGCRCFPRNI